MSNEDRELLVRIDQNLLNFSDLVEKHISDDKESFESISGRLKVLERAFWVCSGVIIAIEVLGRFIK